MISIQGNGSELPYAPTARSSIVLDVNSQQRHFWSRLKFGTECRGFESLRARHHFRRMALAGYLQIGFQGILLSMMRRALN